KSRYTNFEWQAVMKTCTIFVLFLVATAQEPNCRVTLGIRTFLWFQSRTILLCVTLLQLRDCLVENCIPARPKILKCLRYYDLRLHPNTQKLFSIRVSPTPRTYAAGAATRQLEVKGLPGATGAPLANDRSTATLVESDEKVLGRGERARTDQQDDGLRIVMCGVGKEDAARCREHYDRSAPSAEGGLVIPRLPEFKRNEFVDECGKDPHGDRRIPAAVVSEIKDQGIRAGDLV